MRCLHRREYHALVTRHSEKQPGSTCHTSDRTVDETDSKHGSEDNRSSATLCSLVYQLDDGHASRRVKDCFRVREAEKHYEDKGDPAGSLISSRSLVFR